jgi:hypothetical protein
MRLDHPISQKVQQGAVFNCLRVPDYDNCACYGIVLTARCDLEHAKSSVINFLPIVRFSDWIRREMCYILAKRLYVDVKQSIDALLDKNQVSNAVRTTFPLRDIIGKQKNAKDQTTLLQKCDQLELISAALASGGAYFPESKSLASINIKVTDIVIRELITQKLAEYYFLDATDYGTKQGEGFVALLRNMQTMPIALMKQISDGIEQTGPDVASPRETVLTFAHETICMITGVLRSPDIEHLAQQFSNLFVRIGLDDHDDTTFQQHMQIAKTL